MDDKRPRFEVADVVRLYGKEYCRAYSPTLAQKRVLKDIAMCRTANLGGHVDVCKSCGYERNSYNSCRNRHCPKCQGPQRAEWVMRRVENILPVPYFHVVFTLPDELNPLALCNKKVIYSMLFKAASKSLLQLASDPKHLGAQIGITAVLHTWGQKMSFHPHLHCVVTGGGLSPNGQDWVSGRTKFFMPVKVLGKLFRGKFLCLLERAWKKKKLDFSKGTATLIDLKVWSTLRDQLYRKNWVVYAKRPFGGSKQVFQYLGRYTHRVAISNHRIINVENKTVKISYHDCADGLRKKALTLNAFEFIRRFLLHILPKCFVRIRHYGLYAGRNIRTKLVAAKKLLCPEQDENRLIPIAEVTSSWWERFLILTGIHMMKCPCCGHALVRLTPRAPPGGV